MEFVFCLCNRASRVKVVSHRGFVSWNFKGFTTCFLVSDSEIVVSITACCKLGSEFALAATRVVTAGLLFWRCIYHSQVLVQSMEKQLCSIPEKGQTREDESGRSFQTLLSQCSLLSATYNVGAEIWASEFQASFCPVSCLITKNDFHSSCCLPCKMGLMAVYLAQETEKQTSKVEEALSWKFSRRAEYILSAVLSVCL